MTCENDPVVAAASGKRRQPSGFAALIFRAAWVVPGIALLCLMLFLSLGRTKLSQVGAELVVTFVYSALISLPSIFLLRRVSHRYSEKFPRLIILIQALVLLCTATFGVLVGGLVLQFIGIIPRGEYWLAFQQAFPFSIIISLMVGLSASSLETLHYKLQTATLELRTRQMEQERANKLLAEAQLSSLESRIHPHFLFNTLNSIAALIPTNPQRAEDTVGKLASLLRFSLNANQSRLVPLAQELKVVRDYLEIESTRFGPRLRFEISAPSSFDAVKVPPLALQTLVENSVKHVVANNPAGATIQVSAGIDAGRIRLEVIDDGPGFSLDAITPEHGLGNLVARLELLFGDKGQLDVTRKNDKTVVGLTFPAET